MTSVPGWLVVIVAHLSPFLAGLGLGWLITRVVGRRFLNRTATFLSLFGPTSLVFLLPPGFVGVGLFDLIILALLLGLGLIAGRSFRALLARRREVALVGISTFAAFLLAEGLVRLLLPHFSPYDERGRTTLFVEGGVVSSQSRAVFPDIYAEPFRSRTQREWHPNRRVLVVGDSIVEGEGAGGPAVAFPAVLEGLDPGTAWINGGFSGTGPDFYLRVVTAWVSRIAVQEVLLVFYTGNDLSNLDEPWAACGGGPLLRYVEGRAMPRCERPDYNLSLAGRIALSPPPLLLRAATAWSLLARHACLAFTRFGRFFVETVDEPRQWEHLEAILRTLRDDLAARSVAFRVLLFPHRPALEDPRPERFGSSVIGERVTALCRTLGIPLLDPTEFLREAVAREGASAWFIGGRGSLDPHLNRAGHAGFARWLLEAMNTQGPRPDDGPGATPHTRTP